MTRVIGAEYQGAEPLELSTCRLTGTTSALVRSWAAVFVATLCSAAFAAEPQLVMIDWTSDSRFEREINVAAGKFVEVCGRLDRAQRIRWSFDSPTAVDFNIHYHEGSAVRMPAQRDHVSRDDGLLVVPVDQDYCWMWTNNNRTDIALRMTLERQ